MSDAAHACPSEEALFGFAEGLLSASGRRRIEHHIGGCPACAMVLGASLNEVEPPLQDRYAVLEELGRGGMGRVVRARDMSLERDVAIKFLLAEALGEGSTERFIREARALAELRHPNVVEVFDIGESDGALFFVMELVEGSDLATWSRGREWSDVLGRLEDAGRGLAAAHARGLLHRDFKPANVLVDRSERARVGDFGLVGENRTASTLDDSMPADLLTRPGTLLGTLPYMAPELLDGQPATTRSDQFGFCVAAWEVLFGERPFMGSTVAEHRVSRRRIPQRPANGRNVPMSIVETLQRGLTFDAAARFPSMDALLSGLRPRRSRAAGFVGAAALGLASLAATAAASPQSPHCVARAQSRADGWSSAGKAELRDRLHGARPHEAAAVTTALERLSSRVEDWASARAEACTTDDASASSDLRAACLDRWADQVDRALDLSAASQVGVDRIPSMLDALGDPSTCASNGAPERDPAPALDAALDEAELRLHAHQWSEAQAKLSTVTDAVFERAQPPLQARYRLLEGRSLIETGEAERGMVRLEDGFIIASRSGLDALAARNTVGLLLQASIQLDTRAVDRWARYAHLHAERAEDAELAASVDIAHARALLRRAEPHAAHAMLERALAKLPQAPSNASVDATGLLARVEFGLERRDDARRLLDQHLALAKAHYGPDHPKLRGALKTLIELDTLQNISPQTDERLQHLRQITEQAFGEDDPRQAEVYMLAGSVALVRQQPESALESFRAGLRQLEDHDNATMLRLALLNGTADAYDAQGDGAGALPIRQQLVDEWTAHAGPHSIYTARFQMLLGEALVEQGRTDEGIEQLRAAIGVLEHAQGDSRVDILVARTMLGEGLAVAGRRAEAQQVLEQAVREADPEQGSPNLRAEAMFALARSIVEDDPARARGVAEDALQLSRESVREEIASWLEAQ